MRVIKFFLVTTLYVVYAASGLAQEEKIKGLSFVGASTPINENDVKPILAVNANWVTLMPYGYVGDDGRVKFNTKWQWWGEKSEGVEETIRLCQKAGLNIMLKPQIWMMNAYTGDFQLSSTREWEVFETSYRSFILTFLKLAEAYEVELFCVGTEWRNFVAARPEFWEKLIREVRAGYKGKLVYAANWDDYAAVPFWDELDYIGVNGYFPISLSSNPGLEELIAGWELQGNKLKAFSEQHGRQVIFTEVGYRSIEGATLKPWEHGNPGKYAEQIQDRAYEALFKVLWDKKWFKGIFIWKWYHNHEQQGGKGDTDFTPQNKAAEERIRTFWAS